MSDYGRHSRAWMEWKMEHRKRKIRRLFYNIIDDLGMVLWCLVGVIGFACILFILGHR